MRKFLLLMLFVCPMAAQAGEVYTVNPCRVLDTRLGLGRVPENGTIDVEIRQEIPAAQMGETADFDCGIPEDATAVFVNFVAVGPSGGGNLKAYVGTPGAASVSNYYSGIGNVSNSGLVELCDSEPCADFTVATTRELDLIIDVTGYVKTPHDNVFDITREVVETWVYVGALGVEQIQVRVADATSAPREISLQCGPTYTSFCSTPENLMGCPLNVLSEPDPNFPRTIFKYSCASGSAGCSRFRGYIFQGPRGVVPVIEEFLVGVPCPA
jgi:hypothetical protein